MHIVRIVIFSLLILYLLLSFVFIHITINYQRHLKRSESTLESLFVGQTSLFMMIEAETKVGVADEDTINKEIQSRDFKNLNKRLLQYEKEYRSVLGSKANPHLIQVFQAVSDNVTLIRNEVYRYNKLIENLNINQSSILFTLFVDLMHLKEQEKI